jgi:hypothetical protein
VQLTQQLDAETRSRRQSEQQLLETRRLSEEGARLSKERIRAAEVRLCYDTHETALLTEKRRWLWKSCIRTNPSGSRKS